MSEKKLPAIPEDRQSQLKLLIARGKEQGYLTYAEVNDHLPPEIVDPEQIEDIVNTINDMGITVHEKAPDAESLLLTDASAPDEEAVEEAAAALAIADSEFGRTTDPVRMYMREMGTVELLTREGEIRIAKRIEEGLDQVRSALAYSPPTYDYLLAAFEPVKAGQGRITDLIVGFLDPNAPDEIAQPHNPKTVVRKEEAEAEDEENEEGADDERRSTPDPIRWRPRSASPRSPACTTRSPRASRRRAAPATPRSCARASAWQSSSWNSSSLRRCSTRSSGTCAATWTKCAASSARSWRSACARPG